MAKITLRCVDEGGKLRIRFHSFMNNEGKIFSNVYNNTYNCRFPKNIRQRGMFYEIPDTDISLIQKPDRAPYYSVKKKNIKIIRDETMFDRLKVYPVDECVICLASKPDTIFFPCGHLCCCNRCYGHLTSRRCPLCRRTVEQIKINKD
jgi:hypothetical protein